MGKKTTSSKRFKPYEFDKSEDGVEKASKEILAKYKNPNSNKSHDDSPVTKYKFLRYFAQGTKTEQKDSINEISVTEANDDAVKEVIPVLDASVLSGSSSYKPAPHSDPLDSGWSCSGLIYAARALNHRVTSIGSRNLDSPLPRVLSDNGPVTIDLDNDDAAELRLSTSVSDVAENGGPFREQALEHHVGGCASDATVVVSPDYVLYKDMYLNKSVLTFSCCWIKVDGSTVCGIEGPLSCEWSVRDILNIKSQWCGLVETAVVNLRLKPKDTKVTENTSPSSGTVELNFAVFDPDWSARQEAIKSLNVRYKAKWNLVLDIDTGRSEDGCLRNNNIFCSKHYLSNPDEPFEEVIYPKGDPDAVSISKRDIELLHPETFLNDTIIDFYIKYLSNKIKAKEKQRFHFFNSFFFRKLADLDKDPSGACEGRAAFQRVRKWTRKSSLEFDCHLPSRGCDKY